MSPAGDASQTFGFCPHSTTPDDHSSTLPIGGLSFVQGRTKLRLLNKTVGRCLEDVAQKYPDREALVVPLENVRLTFAQLKEEVGPDLNPKVDSCLLRLSWLQSLEGGI